MSPGDVAWLLVSEVSAAGALQKIGWGKLQMGETAESGRQPAA